MTEKEALAAMNGLRYMDCLSIRQEDGFLPDGSIGCIRHRIGFRTFSISSNELRAIADILDQVGKEDGKAGEG